MKYRTLYERLVANTVLEHEDNPQSCWLWTGGTDGRGGYGRLAIRIAPRPALPVSIAAHRAMLEEVLECVFPFDEVGHRCYNPRCINPGHLEVQTKIMNLAERRDYKPPEGPLIPVLFPREDDVVWESEDPIYYVECPF